MIKNNTDKNYKIYSTIEDDQSSLTEIETVILHGLYKFSILGINQRYSSDMKDRIYSALRSQKLINLKSDNKKITVNLLPSNINKKSTFYDLGVALSCLYTINKLCLDFNILTVGELSISGNILPTNHIFIAMYQAIKNNINVILCSEADIKIIDTNIDYFHELIIENDLRFIVANDLANIFIKIKNLDYYKFSHTNKISIPQIAVNNKQAQKFVFTDEILKIIIAICTCKNVFIEKSKDSYIQKFIKNLIYYNQRVGALELLKISNMLKLDDQVMFDKYQCPVISILNNQINKDDLLFILKESVFGFNIIDNFINLSDETLSLIKKNHISSILGFYDSCSCGKNNVFFNNYENDKCFCLQKNIIKHRQRVEKFENGFFDLHIKNTYCRGVDYCAEDYININILINKFKKNDMCVLWEKDKIGLDTFYNQNKYEITDIKNIIELAKEIKKLYNIMYGQSSLTLSKEDIEKAMKIFRMGF